jgi:hypothetical protein
MGHEILDKQWTRTPDGKVILRLIEEWEAGVTEHGDVAFSFVSTVGNDPGIASGEPHQAQFICTREDAGEIAHMILRTLAFAEADQTSEFATFRNRIRSPALRAVADLWNQARGDRPMPSWDDIRLEALAPYLGRIWTFDYDRGAGEFIGRVAGSNIMMGFGKSFLGTPLRELHLPPAAEKSHATFLRVISEPACVRFSGKLFRTGEQTVDGERLILPVAATRDRPEGLLGVSHHDYPVPRGPIKIELLHDIADWCAL